jgi:hypothetical protein
VASAERRRSTVAVIHPRSPSEEPGRKLQTTELGSVPVEVKQTVRWAQ